jgi:hypothetical protein
MKYLNKKKYIEPTIFSKGRVSGLPSLLDPTNYKKFQLDRALHAPIIKIICFYLTIDSEPLQLVT